METQKTQNQKLKVQNTRVSLLQIQEKKEGKNMEITNTMSVISQRALEIFDALKLSRENILESSNGIATMELQVQNLKDEINVAKSLAFVEAATEVNELGKLVNPNITSQEAATTVKLIAIENYGTMQLKLRNLLKDIQVDKNNIIFQHELRGDLKTEADFLKNCIKAETECGCK